MTEVEQQAATATAEEKKEDEAPALPTTEPPKDEEKKDVEVPASGAAEAEKKEEAKKKKEEEPPKDIREDPVGWVAQQIPQAVHIVNYNILNWAQNFAIEDESKRVPLPGKNGQVTKKQFLNFLKDGQLLAALTKKLAPSKVENIHEGDAAKEKANQTANIDVFANYAKEDLGIPEDKIFSATDLLEKGKAAYPAVFGALWQAGIQARDKFGATSGINIDEIITAAGAAVPRNFIQIILNFFKRARPSSQQEKQAALEAEEKEKADKKKDGENADVEEVVEEECKKVEAGPAVVAAN